MELPQEPLAKRTKSGQSDFTQVKKGETLQSPREFSNTNLLGKVRQRASFGNVEMIRINDRLNDETGSSLKSNNAKWHSKCNSDVIHQGATARDERYYTQACKERDTSQMLTRRKGQGKIKSI